MIAAAGARLGHDYRAVRFLRFGYFRDGFIRATADLHAFLISAISGKAPPCERLSGLFFPAFSADEISSARKPTPTSHFYFLDDSAMPLPCRDWLFFIVSAFAFSGKNKVRVLFRHGRSFFPLFSFLMIRDISARASRHGFL